MLFCIMSSDYIFSFKYVDLDALYDSVMYLMSVVRLFQTECSW